MRIGNNAYSRGWTPATVGRHMIELRGVYAGLGVMGTEAVTVTLVANADFTDTEMVRLHLIAGPTFAVYDDWQDRILRTEQQSVV